MAKQTNKNWEPWHEERASFKKRDSAGLTKDLQALQAHILKLQDLAPKDKAGWPSLTALHVIDALRDDYNRFTRYLDQLH